MQVERPTGASAGTPDEVVTLQAWRLASRFGGGGGGGGVTAEDLRRMGREVVASVTSGMKGDLGLELSVVDATPGLEVVAVTKAAKPFGPPSSDGWPPPPDVPLLPGDYILGANWRPLGDILGSDGRTKPGKPAIPIAGPKDVLKAIEQLRGPKKQLPVRLNVWRFDLWNSAGDSNDEGSDGEGGAGAAAGRRPRASSAPASASAFASAPGAASGALTKPPLSPVREGRMSGAGSTSPGGGGGGGGGDDSFDGPSASPPRRAMVAKAVAAAEEAKAALSAAVAAAAASPTGSPPAGTPSISELESQLERANLVLEISKEEAEQAAAAALSSQPGAALPPPPAATPPPLSPPLPPAPAPPPPVPGTPGSGVVVLSGAHVQEVDLPSLSSGRSGLTVARHHDGSGRCVVTRADPAGEAFARGIRAKDVVVGVVKPGGPGEGGELMGASDYDLMVEFSGGSASSTSSSSGGGGRTLQVWYLEPLDARVESTDMDDFGEDLCVTLRVSASSLATALQGAKQATGGAVGAFERLFGLALGGGGAGAVLVTETAVGGVAAGAGVRRGDQLTGVEHIPNAVADDDSASGAPNPQATADVWKLIRSRLQHQLELLEQGTLAGHQGQFGSPNSNKGGGGGGPKRASGGHESEALAAAAAAVDSLTVRINIWRPKPCPPVHAQQLAQQPRLPVESSKAPSASLVSLASQASDAPDDESELGSAEASLLGAHFASSPGSATPAVSQQSQQSPQPGEGEKCIEIETDGDGDDEEAARAEAAAMRKYMRQRQPRAQGAARRSDSGIRSQLSLNTLTETEAGDDDSMLDSDNTFNEESTFNQDSGGDGRIGVADDITATDRSASQSEGISILTSASASVLTASAGPYAAQHAATLAGQPATAAAAPVTKARLVALYAARNPDKLGEVDSLLGKYAGRDEAMWDACRKEYGAAAVDEAWDAATVETAYAGAPPAGTATEEAPAAQPRPVAAAAGGAAESATASRAKSAVAAAHAHFDGGPVSAGLVPPLDLGALGRQQQQPAEEAFLPLAAPRAALSPRSTAGGGGSASARCQPAGEPPSPRLARGPLGAASAGAGLRPPASPRSSGSAVGSAASTLAAGSTASQGGATDASAAATSGTFIEAEGELDEAGTLDLSRQGLPSFTLPPVFLGGGGLDAMLARRGRLVRLDLSHNALTVVDAALLAVALGDGNNAGGGGGGSGAALRHLNVSHNKLVRLCGGGPGSQFPWSMASLETLDASHNAITRISGLDRLTGLRSLNLAHNKVKTLSGLESLTEHLFMLQLHHNAVESVAALRPLSGNRALRALTLAGNPVVGDPAPGATSASCGPAHRAAILVLLPHLTTIDGRALPHQPRAAMARPTASSRGRASTATAQQQRQADVARSAARGSSPARHRAGSSGGQWSPGRRETSPVTRQGSPGSARPVVVTWDGYRWNAPASLEDMAQPRAKVEKSEHASKKKNSNKVYVFGATHVRPPPPPPAKPRKVVPRTQEQEKRYAAQAAAAAKAKASSQGHETAASADLTAKGSSSRFTVHAGLHPPGFIAGSIHAGASKAGHPVPFSARSGSPRAAAAGAAAQVPSYMLPTKQSAEMRDARLQELAARNLITGPYLGGAPAAAHAKASEEARRKKAAEKAQIKALRAEINRLHALHAKGLEVVRRQQAQVLGLAAALSHKAQAAGGGAGGAGGAGAEGGGGGGAMGLDPEQWALLAQLEAQHAALLVKHASSEHQAGGAGSGGGGGGVGGLAGLSSVLGDGDELLRDESVARRLRLVQSSINMGDNASDDGTASDLSASARVGSGISAGGGAVGGGGLFGREGGSEQPLRQRDGDGSVASAGEAQLLESKRRRAERAAGGEGFDEEDEQNVAPNGHSPGGGGDRGGGVPPTSPLSPGAARASAAGHGRKVKAWARRLDEEAETSGAALGMLLAMHERREANADALARFAATLADLGLERGGPAPMLPSVRASVNALRQAAATGGGGGDPVVAALDAASASADAVRGRLFALLDLTAAAVASGSDRGSSEDLAAFFTALAASGIMPVPRALLDGSSAAAVAAPAAAAARADSQGTVVASASEDAQDLKKKGVSPEDKAASKDQADKAAKAAKFKADAKAAAGVEAEAKVAAAAAAAAKKKAEVDAARAAQIKAAAVALAAEIAAAEAEGADSSFESTSSMVSSVTGPRAGSGDGGDGDGAAQLSAGAAGDAYDSDASSSSSRSRASAAAPAASAAPLSAIERIRAAAAAGGGASGGGGGGAGTRMSDKAYALLQSAGGDDSDGSDSESNSDGDVESAHGVTRTALRRSRSSLRSSGDLSVSRSPSRDSSRARQTAGNAAKAAEAAATLAAARGSALPPLLTASEALIFSPSTEGTMSPGSDAGGSVNSVRSSLTAASGADSLPAMGLDFGDEDPRRSSQRVDSSASPEASIEASPKAAGAEGKAASDVAAEAAVSETDASGSGEGSGSEDEDDEPAYDWVEGWDPNHQLFYYFNVHTQGSQWVKPEDGNYKPYNPEEFESTEDEGSGDESESGDGEGSVTGSETSSRA